MFPHKPAPSSIVSTCTTIIYHLVTEVENLKGRKLETIFISPSLSSLLQPINQCIQHILPSSISQTSSCLSDTNIIDTIKWFIMSHLLFFLSHLPYRLQFGLSKCNMDQFSIVNNGYFQNKITSRKLYSPGDDVHRFGCRTRNGLNSLAKLLPLLHLMEFSEGVPTRIQKNKVSRAG